MRNHASRFVRPRPILLLVGTAALLAACNDEADRLTQPSPVPSYQRGPAAGQDNPRLRAVRHYKRVADPRPFDGYSLGPLVLRGGNVMTSTVTYAIFWGPRWNTNTQFTTD